MDNEKFKSNLYLMGSIFELFSEKRNIVAFYTKLEIYNAGKH